MLSNNLNDKIRGRGEGGGRERKKEEKEEKEEMERKKNGESYKWNRREKNFQWNECVEIGKTMQNVSKFREIERFGEQEERKS